ncbi:MAG: hypothetical protein ABSH52_09155 [Terriglobia bacterium]
MKIPLKPSLFLENLESPIPYLMKDHEPDILKNVHCIDPGLRALVRELNESGFRTDMSCSGGLGHYGFNGNCLRAYISFFPEPWTQNVAAIEECAGALGLEVGRIKQTRDVYLTPADENISRGCEWFVERVRRFFGLASREGGGVETQSLFSPY